MRFIGRKQELERIEKILNKPEQNNILIYGRRRIGKSYLVRKALENYKGVVIQYQCKQINIEKTIDEISSIIKKQLNLSNYTRFSSFEEILDFLFSQKRDILLVLDEYPYLLNKVDGLNSILQSKIDEYKYNSQLKTIILGSQIEIMKNMLEYSNPLYGRFSDIIELKEHNYYESSEYYPSYSLEDKVMLYSVFGGEPLYNSLVDERKTALENIIELFIKENSFVELNINNMLNIEISKINYANDILLAIASGVKKNDDLVTKSHAGSPANLNPALSRLLKLDLVKKTTPINDENNKKKTMYYINNNTLYFYYKYLYNYSNERSNMNEINFYKEFIENDFKRFVIPKVFEEIVKQYLIIKNKNNELENPFSKIGTYWYDDKINKKNGQFDVVTYDKNGYIFYEIKYTNNQIDKKVVNEEIRQLSEIDLPYYKLGFVSKSGFKDIEGDYILLTLEDIYNLK